MTMKGANFLEKLLDNQPVEWKKLGEVAELKRGKTITQKEAQKGNFPVISGGQKPAYYINQFNREGQTITIAGSGAYAGFVQYWEEPIFVSDAFSIKANEEYALPKFIYHFLLNIQDKLYHLKRGSGVPHVYAKDVAEFPIPSLPYLFNLVLWRYWINSLRWKRSWKRNLNSARSNTPTTASNFLTSLIPPQ